MYYALLVGVVRCKYSAEQNDILGGSPVTEFSINHSTVSITLSIFAYNRANSWRDT